MYIRAKLSKDSGAKLKGLRRIKPLCQPVAAINDCMICSPTGGQIFLFKQKQFDKGKTVERRRRKTKGAKASNRNASQLPDLYQRFFTYPTTEG